MGFLMRQTSFLPPTISVKALKEHKTLTLTSGRASSFLYPPKTFFLSSMPVQYHPLPPLKGKGFPYSLPSVRSRADPDVQAVHLAIGCNYFPPGLRLPSQPQRITAPWLVPNYTAWWQRHIGANNLPKVVTQLLPWVRFEPMTRRSQVQRSTIAPPCHHYCS